MSVLPLGKVWFYLLTIIGSVSYLNHVRFTFLVRWLSLDWHVSRRALTPSLCGGKGSGDPRQAERAWKTARGCETCLGVERSIKRARCVGSDMFRDSRFDRIVACPAHSNRIVADMQSSFRVKDPKPCELYLHDASEPSWNPLLVH